MHRMQRTIFFMKLFDRLIIPYNQLRYLKSDEKKNHYDALGLTPHATQADIKTAYYRLSMQHHPDRNIGDGHEEASAKFRQITAAYEVLGNAKQRRLYDRGLYYDGGVQTPPQTKTTPDDAKAKFYRSREVRARPPPPGGRTYNYDFDEWSRVHYGATFARSQHHRQREAAKKLHKAELKDQAKIEHLICVVAALIVGVLYMGAINENYDEIDEKIEK